MKLNAQRIYAKLIDRYGANSQETCSTCIHHASYLTGPRTRIKTCLQHGIITFHWHTDQWGSTWTACNLWEHNPSLDLTPEELRATQQELLQAYKELHYAITYHHPEDEHHELMLTAYVFGHRRPPHRMLPRNAAHYATRQAAKTGDLRRIDLGPCKTIQELRQAWYDQKENKPTLMLFHDANRQPDWPPYFLRECANTYYQPWHHYLNPELLDQLTQRQDTMPTVTVAEAARQLGVSRQTTRRLIKTGEITARRLTLAPRSAFRVDQASLDAYIDKRNQP